MNHQGTLQSSHFSNVKCKLKTNIKQTGMYKHQTHAPLDVCVYMLHAICQYAQFGECAVQFDTGLILGLWYRSGVRMRFMPWLHVK